MRVRHAAFEAGNGIAAAAFCLHGVGHVVAKAEVVAGAFTQNGLIAGFHLDVEATAFPFVEHVARVVAAQLHVGKHIAFTHRFLGEHHIFRLAGEWIERHHRQHAADFHLRVDATRGFHGESAGHELMVQHLVHGLFRIFMFGVDHAGAAVAEQRRAPVALVVNFIEGHPVFDLALVAFKHHFRETHKEINNFTVSPAAVLLHQVQRHFKVGEGNHRLNVVFEQLIEHIVVEFQPFFVGLAFIAVREDTGPRNRRAEAFEAHLGEQFDVFFIVAVEVDGFVVGIVFTRHYFLSNFARYAVRAAGEDVTDAGAFTAFIPAAFNLVRGNCATP